MYPLALAFVLTGPSPPLVPLHLPGAPALPLLSTMKLSVGLAGAKGEGYLTGFGGEGSIKVKAGLVSREVDATLTEVDIQDVVRFLDIKGLPEILNLALRGRVGSVVIAVRGDDVSVTATGWRMFNGNTPVQRLDVKANLKTREVFVVGKVFGGTVELKAKLPPEVSK